MPFVQRVVEPRFLSRTSLRDADGHSRVGDEELQAVTNCTLSSALRQLASLVLLAEDIFSELTLQLNGITERSKVVQVKIEKVCEVVEQYDPKKVPVPEGSLSNFATRKVHYTAKHPLSKELFTADSRPGCLRELYARAVSGRLPASLLEQLRRDSQHSPYLLCTPVLSSKRRRIYQKIDVDIETHIPASVEYLRKWTSKEAMGDVTALTDASTRIASGVTLTPEELSDASEDEALDHQLPSPEEQLRVIASKFPPELVPIDTSGRFFDRMCTSRKSLLHIETNGETDTVKRRTRSRKPRGKRRNTISGTDQKELREAIAGDTSNAVASQEITSSTTVVRSHSSDLLKKSPIDPIAKKGHFNSLRQWGKTRLKMIGRSPSASRDSFRDSLKIDKAKETKSQTHPDSESATQEPVTLRKKRTTDDERRQSHQRCASYSSSEKSIGVPVPNTATISTGVKLRNSSTQRRLRRSGIGKDEPHSSSGNWSASSESGRTSIGSEITTTTIPPKSTTSAATSNNSLNLHSHGPPSSIISRRRFLNTSGSGSVTSEGTLTPDIIHDLHEDMETSSEYSCDTEGYYTSFHMDSGLKTLKEEDIAPGTPLHTSNALSNSSNSQNLTAENEYELFGKGSTSTTTSSAGTVCTTLMAAGSDRSLVIGPTVPERNSSLAKLNRSKTGIHSANASLDRSLGSAITKGPYNTLRYCTLRANSDKYGQNQSSPEINDSPASTITITKNVGRSSEMTAVVEVHIEAETESAKKSTGTSSPDSGHNTSSSPIEDSVSSAHGKNSLSEQDYSESSDLEGTDRIERIRYKTTINSSRIPSLCVITPTNSDDESVTSYKGPELNKKAADIETAKNGCTDNAIRPKLELPNQKNEDKLLDKKSKDASNNDTTKPVSSTQKPTQHNIKNSLHPFNSLMCKLKGVLPYKLTSKKSPVTKEPELTENVYDSGDYVTIADVRNNNQKVNLKGLYGNNESVKQNLQTVLSGKLQETEYVSLNELPNCLTGSKDYLDHSLETNNLPVIDEVHQKGAKVTLDSHGKVIYSSDSIKRRKGAHTTFEPGPFVQNVRPTSPAIQRDSIDAVERNLNDIGIPVNPPVSKPTSPQLGKVIIKSPIERHGLVTTEIIALPAPKPSTIITATPLSNKTHGPVKPQLITMGKSKIGEDTVDATTRLGAYVNINDAEGVSLSPTKDNPADSRRSYADKPYLNLPQHVVENKMRQLSLTSQQTTAHLQGRHGTISYKNPPSYTFQTGDPRYWTLPKQSTSGQLPTTGLAADIKPEFMQLSTRANVVQVPVRQYPQVYSVDNDTPYDESLKISPIDPRTTGPFQSSTPSNKQTAIDLGSKLLSPVKSSMTNEELYAVIHKSKKKLNIKDQADRAGSPALSTISLSPVNSEISLVNKGVPRYPETGYLMDSRSRNSWAPQSEHQMASSFQSISSRSPAKPESTCADRYGPTQQTSRLDFKKLLLQHSVKLNALPQQKISKLSAVEQLKISREKPPSPTSQVNILDLSGSPKTYSNRKFNRNMAPPSSPNRTSALIKEHKSTPKILLSPKSQWRFSSPRSDVLSSPIAEVHNEDETSNSSGEKHESSPVSSVSPKTVPIVTNQHFGARRNLIPINENVLETDCDFADPGVVPLVGETIDVRFQNLSRMEMLQAKRAEFFKSSPEKSPPRFTSFKSPVTNSADTKVQPPEDLRTSSPSALETAL